MTFYTQTNRILNTYTLKNFLSLKIPVLNFLNFLSSQVLLSYKPLSLKKSALKFSKNSCSVKKIVSTGLCYI